MLAFKAGLCVLTLAAAFFFAFWERKLIHELTDGIVEKQHENVSDIDSFYEFRRDIRRIRILGSLPRKARFKLRIITSLKLLFAAILVVEVLFLPR